MKEFIEKLIGRLTELPTKAIDRYKGGTFGNWEGTDYFIKQSDAIEIINQLAEEYKPCNKPSCKDCEVYDKEKHYCPKWCEVIKHTASELAEEYNNGWIPCSELPEENGMYLCTVFHADDYVVWIMRFNDGEFLKPDDVEDWNYELLAWMPIAPYQPKGE